MFDLERRWLKLLWHEFTRELFRSWAVGFLREHAAHDAIVLPVSVLTADCVSAQNRRLVLSMTRIAVGMGARSQ
jgi:hypothetical protein